MCDHAIGVAFVSQYLHSLVDDLFDIIIYGISLRSLHELRCDKIARWLSNVKSGMYRKGTETKRGDVACTEDRSYRLRVSRPRPVHK